MVLFSLHASLVFAYLIARPTLQRCWVIAAVLVVRFDCGWEVCLTCS